MKTVEAVVEAILIADQPGTFITRPVAHAHLEFGGIPGDRHFGLTSPADSRQPMYKKGTEIWNRRQVTVLSKEECAAIAKEMGIPEVLPQWLGANLLLSGMGMSELAMGSRILFPSGAGLYCMGENKPCTLPGKVIRDQYPEQRISPPQFVGAAHRRRGIVCAVECPGKISQGDRVRILLNDFGDPMQ